MPRIPDPQITPLQKWLLVLSDGSIYMESEVSEMELRSRGHKYITRMTGYGVRAGHSDIFPWIVYATQLEADEAFEFLAEGRIYSAEAA